MMNKNLAKKLVEVGKQWQAGDRDYSFETRIFGVWPESQLPQGGLIAIIEVQGFYRCEDMSDAIKLHYEEVFSTPDWLDQNLSEEQIANYVTSFEKKLDEFSKKVYETIRDTLAQEKQEHGEIYSSDPMYWQ